MAGGLRPGVDVLRNYLASETCDLERLVSYAIRLNNGAVFKRLGFLMERLAPAVNAGRQQDLRNAERWIREGTGSNLGDVAVANDRPIREVATEILGLLEWH